MIEDVLGSELIVVCGPGGVGKTTTAAALGASVARNHARRVLVITVDPARRLATALGLEAFGNVARTVDGEAWSSAGVTPKGELSIVMLDTKASWDDLVRAHAPDPKTRDAILDNVLYQNLTGRFIQSHDYVAMERLHELHQSGDYDLIVVDTPPSRHAIDFLDAPDRMADFFSSRLLKWLIAPNRLPFAGVMSRTFTSVADRVLGAGFMGDIAEFFTLLHTMHPGFVKRANAVNATLQSDQTRFVVVSTLAVEPVREATFLATTLRDRGLDLHAIVANRTLPSSLHTDAGRRAASRIGNDPEAIAAEMVPGASDDAERVATAVVFAELAASYERYRGVLNQQSSRRTDLESLAPQFVAVADHGEAVADLRGVLAVGKQLVG